MGVFFRVLLVSFIIVGGVVLVVWGCSFSVRIWLISCCIVVIFCAGFVWVVGSMIFVTRFGWHWFLF